MPTCMKCHDDFPNRAKIEGKVRNLGSRHYCLKCSPWGARNTKPLHGEAALRIPATQQAVTLTCSVCSRVYVYDLTPGTKRKGHTRDRCNSCAVNSRRFSKKHQGVEYLGGKCVLCGYDRCVQSLHFHHKDPNEKDFTISGKHCYSWERIRKELDKCALLCANCHGEVHAGIAILE